MKFIKWSDEMSVGIEEIDAQHKVLLALLNKTYQSIDQGQDEEGIRKIIEELYNYTKFHFAMEESLMQLLNYTKYKQHKKLHDHLVAQMDEFNVKMASFTGAASFELARFIKLWLIEHIVKIDKRYTSHFLSHCDWQKLSKVYFSG